MEKNGLSYVGYDTTDVEENKAELLPRTIYKK